MIGDSMKRLLFFLLTLLMVVLLAFPAFASEAPEAGEGESSSGTPTVSVPDVNVYNAVTVEDPGLGDYLGSNVTAYAAYTSSSGSNSLKSVLMQFLGDWDTVVVQHVYQAEDGSINTVAESIPDYPWLCSAGLLCLMIFCLFRLGGAILCKT